MLRLMSEFEPTANPALLLFCLTMAVLLVQGVSLHPPTRQHQQHACGFKVLQGSSVNGCHLHAVSKTQDIPSRHLSLAVKPLV
jgi:hypothetical protein